MGAGDAQGCSVCVCVYVCVCVCVWCVCPSGIVPEIREQAMLMGARAAEAVREGWLPDSIHRGEESLTELILELRRRNQQQRTHELQVPRPLFLPLFFFFFKINSVPTNCWARHIWRMGVSSSSYGACTIYDNVSTNYRFVRRRPLSSPPLNLDDAPCQGGAGGGGGRGSRPST
jgi:hypothetical protein